MQNYHRKYQILSIAQKGKCYLSGKDLHPMSREMPLPKVDMHHAVIHDSKWARGCYPLLIDSVLNLMLVLHDEHMSKPLPRQWPMSKCAEVEARLEKDEKLARAVNGEAFLYDAGELAEIWRKLWYESV